jgi:queuine tRNA-ribosyltransferase
MELKDFGKKYIFMPDATRGAVRFLTTEQLKETGTEAIVTNTLHLMMSPGSKRIQDLGGIKPFMNWNGLVLTDSGGFQVFSLIHSGKWKGKVHENGATFNSPITGDIYELTPESSIDTQIQIGSDILVTLDDCRNTDLSREEAEESVERTIAWAKRCKDHFENVYGGTKETGKLLSCVVQGANFPDLRKRCAEELTQIGFDGYNFGGFVVDSDGELVLDEMAAVVENTPKDKFKYAMGVGKPEDIRRAAKIGYTVFDTVLVTRNARHGTLYSSDIPNEVLRITNAEYATDQRPIDSHCDCYTCRNHSRAYVYQMLRAGEATGMTLATIHNLRYYQRLIDGLNNSSIK